MGVISLQFMINPDNLWPCRQAVGWTRQPRRGSRAFVRRPCGRTRKSGSYGPNPGPPETHRFPMRFPARLCPPMHYLGKMITRRLPGTLLRPQISPSERPTLRSLPPFLGQEGWPTSSGISLAVDFPFEPVGGPAMQPWRRCCRMSGKPFGMNCRRCASTVPG